MNDGPALVDGFGRVATDLRISVTDRCDFRCTYCMPEGGLEWLPADDVLTFEEIERVARIAKSLGVVSVRLTGGEPLVRPRLEELIAKLSAVGFEDVSMTTNGSTLARHAKRLRTAGLDRVNVSLDSLDHLKFSMMSRRDKLDAVLEGIRCASDAGLTPLKINCVVVRGVNDGEIMAFAELARSVDAEVRFIEYMPLDADRRWKAEEVVPGAEIVEQINEHHRLIPAGGQSSPASVYNFADGSLGSIGVISSVSKPFCSTCDRLRLTADGQLRNCLFASTETDLKTLLRDGSTDDDLVAAFVSCVSAKMSGHGIGTPVFLRPERSMSMIGG